MDFNATIDLIIKDLNEAREIIDDLKRYPGVPILQVELAKLKCKTAGEVIALLKTPHRKVTPEEKSEQVIPGPVNNETPVVKTETHSQYDAESHSPAIKKEIADQPVKRASESSIIADKFSDHSGSLYEQIGGVNAEEELSDILKAKAISSLSEEIGINDRFLFIREIFNNNKDEYTQAISRLENAECFEDAKDMLMSYTDNNEDNEPVKQLLDLLKRKFPLNE
jgi:hypothetical protein